MPKIVLQTGSPRGTFKFGDPHPEVPDRFYTGWNAARNNEKWNSGASLKANRKARAERREKNRAKMREYSKAHYQANKEKRREQAARWFQKNKEKKYETCRKWREENRGKWNNYSTTRKNRMVNSGNRNELIDEIYACCDRLNRAAGEKMFEVDHTVPVSLGGHHEPWNLQIVPSEWNRSKHNRHTNRWEGSYVDLVKN